MNAHTQPLFRVTLADTPELQQAAQRLRYQVFVEELGAAGSMVDHAARLEQDQFDAFSDQMVLIDDATGAVVGVYRLMQAHHARAAGQFYSEGEYDLTPLIASERKLLELGRSCLHPEYRGGAGMLHLWNGLAEYVEAHGIEVLFGVASFHGTDSAAYAEALSLLHYRHLASGAMRPVAKPPGAVAMDLLAEDQIDRRVAMRQVPALIKGYLRLGGVVGQGAFVDEAFNTIDICLIMDTAEMNARQRQIYSGRT